MRHLAFYAQGKRALGESSAQGLPKIKHFHKKLFGGSDHATAQASSGAETHNQSRRRDGAGCRRTGSFAGGECIRIHITRC